MNGIPDEDNMTEEDALQIAWDAVIDKYDIKETVLAEKFKVQIFFNVFDPDNPIWDIQFRVKDGVDVNEFGYYSVDIDDQTREVTAVYSIADAHG